MHLKIRHRTEYRYETPVHYSIQELRLTPPQVAGQQIEKWKISTPIKSTASQDAFGNTCSVFVQEAPYTSMMIEAEGEVRTQGAFEYIDDLKAASPYYLLQQTNLTEPAEAALTLPINRSPLAKVIVPEAARSIKEAASVLPLISSLTAAVAALDTIANLA